MIDVSVDIGLDDERWSFIVGRNGTWTPKAVAVWQGEGPTAHIEAIGARGNPIRGGISFPAEKMDVLAMRWLQARGLVMPASNGSLSKRTMAREAKA